MVVILSKIPRKFCTCAEVEERFRDSKMASDVNKCCICQTRKSCRFHSILWYKEELQHCFVSIEDQNVLEDCSKLCSTCVNYLKQFRKTGTTFAHHANCKGNAGFQKQRNTGGKRSPVFKEPALVNFPKQVLLIISSLHPIRPLVNLSSVSKRLQHVISSGLAQILWHDKVLAEFPDAAVISSKPANQTWKEIYIFNYLKRKWKEEMEQQHSGVIRSLNRQIEELEDKVTISHVMREETQRKLLTVTLEWPREGGGGGCHPPTGLSNFSQKWEELFCKLNFFCRLILGTSAHEKIFQIGNTILALKLDKGRVLGGGNPPPH